MNGAERDSVVDLYKALVGVDRDDDINDALAVAQRALRRLKAAISELSKRNYILEQDVRYLDTRIALLIQNKINADEAHEVARRLSSPTLVADDEVLSDEAAERYGALLFLLQSEPAHIAWLCTQVSMHEIDELLQTVMFSIYGNQFDAREEHLLLVMFQQVLASQFESTTDFSSLLRANTPVSRMMMTYTRRGPGQAYLQDVVAAGVSDIIRCDQDFDISPLRVFTELKNANPQDEGYFTPFTVQNAASHPRYPQIQANIEGRYAYLQYYVKSLLDLVISEIDRVPYGIRWMAKQVRLLATRKFPNVPAHQTASLIGGYFFLRFINPAIVTPHAYMLVDEVPNPRARRNLTIVAKIIQLIANHASGSKEVFTVQINDFVNDLGVWVTQFLHDLCDVPDFYDSLELDQYLALTTPERKLKISHLELVNTHRLLSKYPTSNERLADFLLELGEVPPVPPRGGKVQLELPLASRWEAISGSVGLDSDEVRANVKFLEAKSLLVNIRRAFPKLPVSLPLSVVVDYAVQSPDRVIADRGLKAKIMLTGYSSDSADAERQLLEDEVELEVERLGSLITAVERETKSLRNVYNSVHEHNEYLESQLETYRSYLSNVRLQQKSRKTQQKPLQKNNQKQATVTQVFSPSQLFDKGVLKRWPYGNWVSSLLTLRFTTLSPGSYTMSLIHSDRATIPLLVLSFTLDDLLELRDQKRDVDLRCLRMSPAPLIDLVEAAQ